MKILRTVASIGLMAGLSINSGAIGQIAEDVPIITELTPLNEYMNRPADQRVDSYAFIRCAGLFLGFKYYAGANLDAATAAQADQTIAVFRDRGIYENVQWMAEQRGVSVDSMSDEDAEIIIKDTWININSIAFFYDDRFKVNFVSDGAAFSVDEMVVQDFELCGQFAQMLADAQQ